MTDFGQRDALISERILESMRDGVVSIDLTGRIITFNGAAGRILGKKPEDVLGRSFAEEFLAEESFDDFNEVVFKAVYEAATTHSIEIALKVDGQRTDLVVASSFLTMEGEDGEEQRFGVVVVFSDTTEERKRRKIKRLFGEYVDPRIVDRILSSEEASRSRRGDMTISFADMRDFTGWSERLDADALVDLLNRFLTAMTEPIGAAGGITDKYIGDAVMACWGPPFTDDAGQARDALNAALGQMEAIAPLRAELAAEGVAGAERMDAVVGVATGDVLSGDIGPPSSRNFTVIGNAVNLAARLQEAAKLYGQHILVADDTAERAGSGFVFREIDRITVRGSHRPVRVYALLGRQGDVAAPAVELAARYGEALAALQARDLDAADAGFAACLEMAPDDRPAALMRGRIAAYRLDPPPEDWDGVWRGAGMAQAARK
ncbi:adenylate/guanylate cyclase domain-containing protein [Acuticoccus mangrovi]|uniref:PAS domain-containing protein n=1 Tax=Acuticoccus mangrovi TaxID=2796142 RepID=A0A934MLG2_9HYPH|nr:adenylate/guanylate cyclase domain-containing protein [Acuticoccus mangrovi]MBJ3776339.1 PAS domain-containing protein [Acuticoccus mangrovi]